MAGEQLVWSRPWCVCWEVTFSNGRFPGQNAASPYSRPVHTNQQARLRLAHPSPYVNRPPKLAHDRGGL